MKRLILVIATLLLFPVLTSAHPGRTASDGCHVCRTNCEKWGVPRGERHCHSRESEPLPVAGRRAAPESKDEAINEIKAPGWEYRLKIQKTGTRVPDKLSGR